MTAIAIYWYAWGRMKKGELIKKVALAAGKGVAIGTLVLFPPLSMPFKLIMDVIEEMEGEKLKRERVRKVLYNLEKRKLISLKRTNGELLVTFNEEGKRLVLKYKLDGMVIKKPRRWDKKWRIVIFDIPEKKKVAREVLRNKLKQLGFYQLQRSVFVHPFECQQEIELITKFYEVGPYVYFMRVDYIDNQKAIKKKFDFF